MAIDLKIPPTEQEIAEWVCVERMAGQSTVIRYRNQMRLAVSLAARAIEKEHEKWGF